MTPPPLWAGAVDDGQFCYIDILRSLQTGKFYLGWTTDLQRRLSQHNSGEVRSTKNRGPYEIVYFEGYRDRQEALARERVLKERPNMLRHIKKHLFRSLNGASCGPKEVVG